MRKQKRKPPVITLVALLMAATYSLGYYQAAKSTESLLNDQHQLERKKAYDDGKQSQDWKVLATNNQVFADKLCTAWWFGATHKDRSIDLTGKPKRN